MENYELNDFFEKIDTLEDKKGSIAEEIGNLFESFAASHGASVKAVKAAHKLHKELNKNTHRAHADLIDYTDMAAKLTEGLPLQLRIGGGEEDA